MVDEHSGKDFELMQKLEDFVAEFLAIIDGGHVDLPFISLIFDFHSKEVISGNSYDKFVQYRLFKNPIRHKEARESFNRFLAEKKKEINAPNL